MLKGKQKSTWNATLEQIMKNALISTKGGATNLKVGDQWIGRWGNQYSKNTKIKKWWGGAWPPPAPMVAPPLNSRPRSCFDLKLKFKVHWALGFDCTTVRVAYTNSWFLKKLLSVYTSKYQRNCETNVNAHYIWN